MRARRSFERRWVGRGAEFWLPQREVREVLGYESYSGPSRVHAERSLSAPLDVGMPGGIRPHRSSTRRVAARGASAAWAHPRVTGPRPGRAGNAEMPVHWTGISAFVTPAGFEPALPP